jgi:hypothetical protein
MIHLDDAANQLVELREILSALGYEYQIEVDELTRDQAKGLFGDVVNMRFRNNADHSS